MKNLILSNKSITLFVSLLLLCISFCDIQNWETIGIYANCQFTCRLFYPFFHINTLHALMNIWCLLSIVFTYNISFLRIIIAYLFSISIPSLFLSATPTVGFSGCIYLLFGSISFSVKRKVYFQLWMFFYIIIGFFLPNTNAMIHLYCYTIGFIIAIINKPIKIR